MNDLKMQVWDTYKKEWVEDFCFLPNGEILGMDKRMNVIFLVSIGADRRYAKRLFVGLKDINGKEIYTGDVVECFREGTSVVVQQKFAFGLETEGLGFTPFYKVYGFCKIIGNIYENPELIKSTE